MGLHTTFLHQAWNHPLHWRMLLLRLMCAVTAIASLVVLGFFWGHHIPEVEAFIANLGVWGPAIFIVLFVVLMPFFVPNAPFALAAGALFGLWWGTVYIVIAGLIAELLLFSSGHKFLRGYVERKLAQHEKLMALRGALTQQPIRLMILLRLSPLPFTPICYAMSTTRVSYRDYLIGFLGYIPGNFVTVYFGYVAKHVVKAAGGVDDLSLPKLIIAIVGLVATIMLVSYVSHAARKAINEVHEGVA